jgi:catechol 2,3-dioxygenase-like lactoylglutathione lyase family enzyme
MTLVNARVEARLPAQDLDRARQWYSDKLGLHPAEERDGGLMYRCGSGVFCLFTSSGAADGAFTQLAFNVDDLETEVADLRARGVTFEEYHTPDLRTVNGIADIDGNYPSKGTGERGAWFRDSEGNMISMGQALP